MSHAETIRDQFTRQAVPFSEAPSIADAAAIQLLIDVAGAAPRHRSLDVACGPGLVVAAFAKIVAEAVGLDATPAMLDRAREIAAQRGVGNVAWQLGEAGALPFDDASFDIVTCRFAFHHIEDPPAALKEMKRVTRRGGAIVVCDGVASEDPAKAAAFNRFEKLRDPSTARFLTEREIQTLFAEAGLTIDAERRYRLPAELEGLMKISFPNPGDEAMARAMMEGAIGDDGLGMGTRREKGRVLFEYPTLICAARR